jgi:hypothetical protein
MERRSNYELFDSFFLMKINLLEWLLLPRELKQASRMKINSSRIKPNLSKKNVSTEPKKKKTTFNIDLNTVSVLFI